MSARPPGHVITRAVSHQDSEFIIPDLYNAESAGRLVRDKMRMIERAVQSTRKKMALVQERRNLKYGSRGTAFQVGELVRLKLSAAEQ